MLTVPVEHCLLLAGSLAIGQSWGHMIMIVFMLFSDGKDVLMIHQLTIWRESVQKEVRHFLYTWIEFLELTAPVEWAGWTPADRRDPSRTLERSKVDGHTSLFSIMSQCRRRGLSSLPEKGSWNQLLDLNGNPAEWTIYPMHFHRSL